MIQVRRSNERGHADFGWLNANYTFSFNRYYDPKWMGFSDLRVINEDYIAGGQGFGTHGHANMEILTYIVDGKLEHRDSMGNGEVIHPHEWQRMTAGTGITHSEFNASETDTTHLLQIWLLPEAENLTPGYEQKTFAPETKTNALKLIASRDAREGSLKINQNTALYNSILEAGKSVTHEFAASRKGWAQIIKGEVTINGETLQAGDGAAINGENTLEITANSDSEFLLFDLN